jgi:N-acetylneuraminate synthase
MWGSDHAASIETQGTHKLVGYIRSTEVALGDGVKRVAAREFDVMRKLRRVSG